MDLVEGDVCRGGFEGWRDLWMDGSSPADRSQKPHGRMNLLLHLDERDKHANNVDPIK